MELTDGQRLEVLSVAELALALPVDGGHTHLIRCVWFQTRQHHRRCRYWVSKQRELISRVGFGFLVLISS